MRRFLKRLKSRFGSVLQSDAAFVEAAYLEILGRPADQDGLDHYCRLLGDGLGRTAVLLSLMRSDEFRRKLKASRPFATIHVDERGYPIHGHLTWADARWWVNRFEAAGFRREAAVERALHLKYDHYMEKRSPARRAFFVFAKNASSEARMAVSKRISGEPSRVLGSSA